MTEIYVRNYGRSLFELRARERPVFHRCRQSSDSASKNNRPQGVGELKEGTGFRRKHAVDSAGRFFPAVPLENISAPQDQISDEVAWSTTY